jgi:hypothetical protein
LNLPPTFGDGAANRPHGWAEMIFFNLSNLVKFSEKVNYTKNTRVVRLRMLDAGGVWLRPIGGRQADPVFEPFGLGLPPITHR